MNDGAAALLLADEASAGKHGLTPKARVLGMATAGVPPRIMGVGPAPATRKVLELTGIRLDQIDVIELNKKPSPRRAWRYCAISALPTTTRASTPTAARSRSAIRSARAEQGALAAVNQLHRGNGRYALCTMCIGVGQGIAVVLERV